MQNAINFQSYQLDRILQILNLIQNPIHYTFSFTWL